MVISCTREKEDGGKGEVSPSNQGHKNQWSCAVKPVLITARRTAAEVLVNHEVQEPQATATACSDSSPGQDPWPDSSRCAAVKL